MDAQFEKARLSLNPSGKYWDAVPREQLEGEEEMEADAAREEAEADRFEQLVAAFEEALQRRGQAPATLPSVTVPQPVVVAPDRPGEARTLHILAGKWKAERRPTIKSDQAMQRAVQRFRELVADMPVPSITKAHIVKFKDALLASGQSGKNVNYSLTQLRVLMNYAEGQDWIKSNPVKGVKVKIDTKESAGEERIAFPEAELNTVFSGPVYSERLRPRGGAGEASYWLPLLGLYTGARVEELCQITAKDVREETYRDGAGKEKKAWVLVLTNEGEGQTLKNSGSRRRLPIHAELLSRGFIEYVDSRKGEERIFPVRVTGTGSKSALWSNWWHRYQRLTLKITDPRLVFHSFRHTFKDVARECGIDKGVRDALQGHTEAGAAGGYGGEFYPLRPLVEAINRYQVHGVSLPD